MGSWAQFTIQTDEWGEDTSWEMFDEDGELIAYHDIRSYFDDYHHERFVCVPPGLLTFTIKDSYGDGKFLGFVQTKLFIFQGVSKGSHFSTRANCGWVLPTLCRYPVQLHQRQRFWGKGNANPPAIGHVQWLDYNITGHEIVTNRYSHWPTHQNSICYAVNSTHARGIFPQSESLSRPIQCCRLGWSVLFGNGYGVHFCVPRNKCAICCLFPKRSTSPK